MANDKSTTDSYNDNSDNSTQNFELAIADSGNDNSTHVWSGGMLFGDGAMVATATLSGYVTGVSVHYDNRDGNGDGAMPDNSLSNDGAAFQNFAGMQALNQNTGASASQNANVSVAVSTGNVTF